MANKKNKRHNASRAARKPAAQAQAPAPAPVADAVATRPAARPARPPRQAAAPATQPKSGSQASVPSAAALAEEYHYVIGDLKRIGILAGSLFALLVVLALAMHLVL